MPEQTVTVKGSPIKSLLRFIDRELDEVQRNELHARLPREIAQKFSSPILATGTVPVSDLNLLTAEAAVVKGEPVKEFAKRAGRAAASDAFNGVYRVFALVLTPEKLLGKASRIWGSLYNRGELYNLKVMLFRECIYCCSLTASWCTIYQRSVPLLVLETCYEIG